MTKDEAIKLGFESHHELIIYYDVCVDLCRIDNYLNNQNDLLVKKNYTKNECLDVIKQYNLMDLLNDVKYKSIYDRLVTIFLYYYNMLQMYNRVTLFYISKLNEATQLSDGEKMNEYLEKMKDSCLEIVKIRYSIDEFLNRIKNRFNESDMINFKKLLLDIGYDNDNEIKL